MTTPLRILRRAVDPASTLAPRRAIPRRAIPAQPLPTPPAAKPGKTHEAAILAALKTLDKVDAQLAMLVRQKAELESAIIGHATEGKLDHVTDGRYEVLEVEVKTKSHRDIVARTVFDVVAERGPREEEAAWAAMSMTATEAGKLLTQAELNKLFPMKPGVKTGTKVVINRVEVKSGKK